MTALRVALVGGICYKKRTLTTHQGYLPCTPTDSPDRPPHAVQARERARALRKKDGASGKLQSPPRDERERERDRERRPRERERERRPLRERDERRPRDRERDLDLERERFDAVAGAAAAAAGAARGWPGGGPSVTGAGAAAAAGGRASLVLILVGGRGCKGVWLGCNNNGRTLLAYKKSQIESPVMYELML